jgi:DNA repair protein RadA/Sms
MNRMDLGNATSCEEVTGFGTNILNVDVPEHLRNRIKTGVKAWDEVIGGGGFVPSQVCLFTGSPGAGKSTMLQLVADGLTRQGHGVVYVSGEESAYQIKMVAERLMLRNGFVISHETYLPRILPDIENMNKEFRARGKYVFTIFDSLQTLNDGQFSERYGEDYVNSKTAQRSLAMITAFSKSNHTIGIVIGQVNKSGQMSGANVLKHMVDAKMDLSIEEKDKEFVGCRLLTCEKNRFGSNGTSYYLKMIEHGFETVCAARLF